MSQFKTTKYYFRVEFNGDKTWTITRLTEVPHDLDVVVKTDTGYATNVFMWNGICDGLMEGRRLICNEVGNNAI